jgi:PKD repeat protein
MRKLLLATLATLATLLLTVLGCQSKTATGPGVVKITETTTSTTTTVVTTSTIPIPTEAKFTFSPVTPEELQVVNFNGSTSVGGTDADGPHTIVSYTWDFGDGDPPKTGVTVTHDFVKTGIYLVTLSVVNDKGTKASGSQSITVRPQIPPKTP